MPTNTEPKLGRVLRAGQGGKTHDEQKEPKGTRGEMPQWLLKANAHVHCVVQSTSLSFLLETVSRLKPVSVSTVGNIRKSKQKPK